MNRIIKIKEKINLHYDIIIIGGGIVGCSILNKLTLKGLKILLLEKNDNLLDGASGGNNAISHCGFDCLPTDGIEARCLKYSFKNNKNFYKKYNVPYKKIGALMIAWKEEDFLKFEEIIKKAKEMGISDCILYNKKELFKLEPFLNKKALGGLKIFHEGVSDSFRMGISLAHHAKLAGATIKLKNKVISINQKDKIWTIKTKKGIYTSNLIINASGLYGDTLEKLKNKKKPAKFKIIPSLGEFIVLSKKASKLINHIILPLPTKQTKGILVYPSIYKNVVIGPTRQTVTYKEKKRHINPKIMEFLFDKGMALIPELRQFNVIGSYEGIRPATEFKDFQIFYDEKINWVSVSGIRSTGFSSCLGIAEYVQELLARFLGDVLEGRNLNRFKEKLEGLVSEENFAFEYLGDRYVRLGREEYFVTHPLTYFGLEQDYKENK